MNLNDLAPGKSVVYFTGPCLARAITHIKAKQTAWEMYLRDEAVLTQRLVPGKFNNVAGTNEYEYIVTRRRGAPRPKEIQKRRDYLNRLQNKGK